MRLYWMISDVKSMLPVWGHMSMQTSIHNSNDAEPFACCMLIRIITAIPDVD